MAKAKITPVQEEQLITLTKEQFQKILEVHSMLDTASDTLNDIDGDDNLFEIGKAVGEAYSTIVDAYNDLGDIIGEKQDEAFEFSFEDEN